MRNDPQADLTQLFSLASLLISYQTQADRHPTPRLWESVVGNPESQDLGKNSKVQHSRISKSLSKRNCTACGEVYCLPQVSLQEVGLSSTTVCAYHLHLALLE